MGLAAAGALVAIGLAYLGLSPRFARRIGLDIYRLDLRVRAFTGYAFALLLLALGFFLAGVPIGENPAGNESVAESTPEATATPTLPVLSEEGLAEVTPGVLPSATPTIGATSSTPATGAFGGLPPSLASPTPEEEESGPAGTSEAATPEAETTEAAPPPPTPTGEPEITPTATESPTATPTPTPTDTPTPTITPTPITGATARIDSSGSNVWVYRSPGGQQLLLVADGDIVILLAGHANQGGVLWQEIQTVDGQVGWIEEIYLAFDEE